MTRMNSRPVSQTVVYAQDTQPTAARDGLLWVDTSESSRPVSVYSSATSSWEPTAPGNVTVSDTEPTGKSAGHVWIDTSLSRPRAKVYDGTQWNKQVDATELGNHKSDTSAHGLGTHKSDASAHHSRPTGTQNASKSGGYHLNTLATQSGDGVIWEVYDTLDEVSITYLDSYQPYWEIRNADGTVFRSGSATNTTETFATREIGQIYVEDGSANSYDVEIEIHRLAVPSHNHSI